MKEEEEVGGDGLWWESAKIKGKRGVKNNRRSVCGESGYVHIN